MFSEEHVRNLLRKTIHGCLLTPSLPGSKFPGTKVSRHIDREKIFREWYLRHGRRSFFLFKKNLKVTNLQFAELLALVRVHLIERVLPVKRAHRDRLPEERTCREVQFMSSLDFHLFAEQLFEPFLQSDRSGRITQRTLSDLNQLIDHYVEMFSDLIVFDSYFGSCVIYTPPTVELDLKAICAYSGYVHSCGIPVLVRNVNETEPHHLRRAIQARVSKGTTRESLRLIVYAHEEFSNSDRNWEEELRHGLDDVKLYEQKCYLGRVPLVRALQDLKNGKADKRVVLTRPGRSRNQSRGLRWSGAYDKTRSLWLISDRSISADITKPEDKRFVICYEQLFKNCNPTHLFEENKPAWVSQTTIPHSLMGAMINLTKPWWPSKGMVLCADPFGGSGTTWFEAEKHKRVICVCSDIARISKLLIQDNYYFLSAEAKDLKLVLAGLEKLIARFTKLGRASPSRIVQHLPKRLRLLLQTYRANKKSASEVRHGGLVPRSLLSLDSPSDRIEALEPKERLILYLGVRADVRHALAFESGREDWITAFVAEADKLRFQLRSLLDFRRSRPRPQSSAQIAVIAREFSDGCVIWPEMFERFARKYPRPLTSLIQDVASIFDGVYDFIATDPPYGFNEDMTLRQLSDLHADLFTHLIRALKDEGQLVIAVPDAALTGKPFPQFTTKNTVIRQVLLAARKEGREVIRSAYMVPRPGGLFVPPYYWESGGSLRRAILHFRFRRRTN